RRPREILSGSLKDSSSMDEESFSEPERISLGRLWHWTGQTWGGLPDGTSLVTPDKADIEVEEDQ
ncbi:MAG: hypothetical protein AAFY88_15165, partial [Acidobacteriota bacterium]